MSRYPGIHAVLYALFDGGERLDRGAMAAQVDYVRSLGAGGVTVLGLATEVTKLSFSERCQIVHWAAEDCGDLPLSVTIAGHSVAEQVAMVRASEAAKAKWLILQPPAVGAFAASEYIDFFSRVGEKTDLPIAIQNAPQYLGRSLSDDDIALLRTRCAGFTHIKAETAAVELAGLIARVGDDLTVLNGRGGLEMTDCMAAGAAGFVVAPDVLAGVVACWRAWQRGEFAAAEAAYAEFLPAATFAMQSLEHLICYGKRIFGSRAGIAIHDRAPTTRPTEFGLGRVAHWSGVKPAGDRA